MCVCVCVCVCVCMYVCVCVCVCERGEGHCLPITNCTREQTTKVTLNNMYTALINSIHRHFIEVKSEQGNLILVSQFEDPAN